MVEPETLLDSVEFREGSRGSGDKVEVEIHRDPHAPRPDHLNAETFLRGRMAHLSDPRSEELPWEELHDWTEVELWIEEELDDDLITLPLHVMDHRVQQFKIGSFDRRNHPQGYVRFDSYRCGVVGIDQESAELRADAVDEDITVYAAAQRIAEEDIDTLNTWLRGDVVRFVKHDTETGELLDACGGFYDIENLRRHAGIPDHADLDV
jgi:hypothetical protein